VGEGIAGAVAQNQKAEFCNDVQSDPRFLAAEYDLERLLAAPVFDKNGAVVGVVNLSDPPNGDDYVDADILRVENFIRSHPLAQE
jgi:putative methionine-R-sulfoxide reductase with GAF domain